MRPNRRIANKVSRYYRNSVVKNVAGNHTEDRSWARVLLAFGLTDDLLPKDRLLSPMRSAEAEAKRRDLGGWRWSPIVKELQRLENANKK